MDAEVRAYFDQILDEVMPEMPDRVHELLESVPMVVEDFPSKRIMRQLDIRHRSHLCGLYTGIPLTGRHVEQSGYLSDVIHLFREGILAMATANGEVDEEELRKQIRITILHELGHHHGMGEEELREMGY